MVKKWAQGKKGGKSQRKTGRSHGWKSKREKKGKKPRKGKVTKKKQAIKT